jgi:16S rRNA (uracil1498-N3)-methyltransferase
MPEVRTQISFAQALEELKNSELSFLCYEGDGTEPIRTLIENKKPKNISFLIGPEGGFSNAEIEAAKEMGISLCGLGKRILRTETAALFVLSAISVICE